MGEVQIVKNSTLQRIALIIILFGGMLLIGIINGIRGLSLPLIKEEFGIGYDMQGFLLLMTTAAGTVAAYFTSVFYRRFGLKAAFIACFVVILAAVFLISFASTFYLVIIAYVVAVATFSVYDVGKNGLALIIFTSRMGTNLSILHLFWGVGSFIGPQFGKFVITSLGMDWRGVYTFLIVPTALLLILVLFISFKLKSSDRVAEESHGQITMREAFKLPVVWLLALSLSLSSAVEAGFTDWSLIYLNDVYGIDPVTVGASFISLFFVVFSVSRLVSGVFVERIGYIRSIFIGNAFTITLLLVSFVLGEIGIWILPFTGIFIALYRPIQVAIVISVFRAKATVMFGAAMTVASLITALCHFLIGQTSRLLGNAWGFRSLIVYALLFFVALVFFKRRIAAVPPPPIS